MPNAVLDIGHFIFQNCVVFKGNIRIFVQENQNIMKAYLLSSLVLGIVLMTSCSKNEEKLQETPNTPSDKQEVQTISPDAYTLSGDGKTLSTWKDIGATTIDLSEDKILNKITAIDKEAFKDNKKITKIILPATLTHIGDKAFQGCSELTSVTIAPTPNAQGEALRELFASTRQHLLRSNQEEGLTLPEGVISIGEYAFAYCGKLKEITLPKGVKQILPNTFSYCNSLEKVTLPQGFTHIGDSTFVGCRRLKEINFPTSLTYIGKKSFMDTALTTAILPDNVTEIGELAFCRTSLTTVKLPKNLKTIEKKVFAFCNSLISIDIPQGLIDIKEGAFGGCKSLVSIDLPNTITHIGKSAFSNCEKLTSIVIPQGVTEIERYTFLMCSSLTSVEFPQGLKKIGKLAFSLCEKLPYVTLPDGLQEIDEGAFQALKELTSIIIPEGILIINEYTFNVCSKLESVALPSTIKEIRQAAFFACNSLNYLTVKAETPPILSPPVFRASYVVDDDVEYRKIDSLHIYVPSASVEAYKKAQYWSEYDNRIQTKN